MMMRKTLAITAVLALVAPAVQADVLFSDSFEYGDTTDNIQDVSNWSTSSGVLRYDHDGGLGHPALEGEAGGSFWHDYTGGSRDITNSVDVDFDITIAEGYEIWFAALAEYKPAGGVVDIEFRAGSVSDLGFGIDSSGNVFVYASDNGGASDDHDTGLDAPADGSTHLLLMRATRGSGGSPETSVIDIWLDPADTSSVAALGGADWSTNADSKWGRDSQANYSEIKIEAAYDARVDELRVGETLNDVAVPEPATMSLLAIGAVGALLKRKRR